MGDRIEKKEKVYFDFFEKGRLIRKSSYWIDPNPILIDHWSDIWFGKRSNYKINRISDHRIEQTNRMIDPSPDIFLQKRSISLITSNNDP